MSKYDPLGEYLEKENQDSITLTFLQIEDIVEFSLPKYLRKYVAGWYGTAEGSPTHVQKAVWQAAGYQVENVNLSKEIVTFRKEKSDS